MTMQGDKGWPVASRKAGQGSVRRSLLRVTLGLQDPNVGQAAILFVEVQAHADHKFVGHLKAQVVWFIWSRPPGGLAEEGHHANRGCARLQPQTRKYAVLA